MTQSINDVGNYKAKQRLSPDAYQFSWKREI
jgi:hypothetical protein